MDPDNLELYDGRLRFIDYQGNIIANQIAPGPLHGIHRGGMWKLNSYLKSPYYRPLGYPNGIYRVGPAARLNVCNGCGTPLADQEWAEFKSLEKARYSAPFTTIMRVSSKFCMPLKKRKHSSVIRKS